MPKVATPKQPKHTSNGSLNSRLKAVKPKPQRTEPLWEGPAGKGPLGGVTQSLISKYLVCKERCRLYVIEGLQEEEAFSHRLEYGNLHHVAEEATAAKKPWEPAVKEYAMKLAKRWPSQSAEIDKWYNVLCQQYPVYLKWWSKHSDVKRRKPLYQEQVFDQWYLLPSMRAVRLRGKWDAVDVIGGKLFLQENKSKGEIEPEKMLSNLRFDLQTMLYLVALKCHNHGSARGPGGPVIAHGKFMEMGGARYCVVRRPLAGGMFTISQRKGLGKAKKGAETPEQFYQRLGELVAENAEHFFYSWKIELGPEDLPSFCHRCLNPILENFLDDYEWWARCKSNPDLPPGYVYDYKARESEFPHHQQRHFLLPFGIWNPVMEDRVHPLDEYILSGSKRGLVTLDTMFKELQPNG